jgi:hypothetical protein
MRGSPREGRLSSSEPTKLRAAGYVVAFICVGMLAVANRGKGSLLSLTEPPANSQTQELAFKLKALRQELERPPQAGEWRGTLTELAKRKFSWQNSEAMTTQWPLVEVAPDKKLTTNPKLLNEWIAEARAELAAIDAVAARPDGHAPVGVVPPMITAVEGAGMRVTVRNTTSGPLVVYPLRYATDDSPQGCFYDETGSRDVSRAPYTLLPGQTREYVMFGRNDDGCLDRGRQLAFEVRRDGALVFASEPVFLRLRARVNQRIAEFEKALSLSPAAP